MRNIFGNILCLYQIIRISDGRLLDDLSRFFNNGGIFEVVLQEREYLEIMSELTNSLLKIAELQNQINRLKKGKMIQDEFNDCMWWEVKEVIENCTEIDGSLYDEKGAWICDGGLVDNVYYCNQSVGYYEDDYYGTMYYKTEKKGVFIAVSYRC